jgi:hypothetical protein
MSTDDLIYLVGELYVQRREQQSEVQRLKSAFTAQKEEYDNLVESLPKKYKPRIEDD